MEAPLLFAIARHRLSQSAAPVQSVWASHRALGVVWAPDRSAGIGPGHVWVFLLNPAQELWMLHESHEAHALLKAESKIDLSRKWSLEIKGARLHDVHGDPRERWIAFELRRRAITGRIEGMMLSFQAITGRGGIRLDGMDLNPARIGMGIPFSNKQPEAEPDTPPMQRWREKWGDSLDAALQGEIADVLPGDGTLVQRHLEWSLSRAEKLLLRPKQQEANRLYIREKQRLERYGKDLAKDYARHHSMLSLQEPAIKLQAELWRLKGTQNSVYLLDGTRIELPQGQRAEETVQRWFAAVKKAKRGLDRVAILERERIRQVVELEAAGLCPGTVIQSPVATKYNKPKTGREKSKVKREKADKRADGKGRAYRSLMVDGFEVLIGKGDADNDNLTFKVANPLDFWLHVAGMPGSHVVIRNPDKLGEPPRNVLERVAELAAFFSKARGGGKVEVHWCRVADVNKPRGFALGKVFLKNHKSLKVYPKE